MNGSITPCTGTARPPHNFRRATDADALSIRSPKSRRSLVSIQDSSSDKLSGTPLPRLPPSRATAQCS